MTMAKKLRKGFKEKYGAWAIVTGATSGIGKEMTLNLCEAGINTILVGRKDEALQTLTKRWEGEYAVKCETVICDLANGNLPAIYQACQGKNLGLFIASAGFGTSGKFVDSPLKREANMLQVNCLALMELTHSFAQHFSQQKRGGIILLSSLVGFQGVPFSANYAASKAYVQSLAEGLHHELKPQGVDVLAAAPGPVATSFAQRANLVMNGAMSPAGISVEILNALGRKMTVLPGFKTKFLIYALRTTPRWGKVRIMKLVMGGMTQHQRT